MINDDRLKKEYNPKTHYQLTFQQVDDGTSHRAWRPGLKVPPRILPDISKKSSTEATVSVNHADFVKLPFVPTKSFKPDKNAHQCGVKLEGKSSYMLDYPQQKLSPRPPVNRVLKTTTMPKIDEIPLKENYVTTNQRMHPKWKEGGRQEGYCEHPTQLYFTGNFGGKSVHKEDYSAAIHVGAKPSTSYKKEERLHSSNKPFYGTTTFRSFHNNLPALVERDHLFLKKRSINNQETMKSQTGPLQKSTQYREDNPGYGFFPPVRGMCAPAPDQLQLFYGHFDGKTEHHSNYIKFKEAPRPRTSFKKTEERHMGGNSFDGTTSMGVDYQPIPIERQMAELKNVDRIAAQVSYYQKDGEQMKHAHHFGGKFTDKSVNKSDYFQFWHTRPRQRHGDRAERVFRPSTAKLASVTESAANYVPLYGKPSQSFKPLDTRFTEDPEKGSQGKRIKVGYWTVYKDDFKEMPLPRRSACQAELLLQQA